MAKQRESLMLALLPAGERERLNPFLEWIEMDRIYEVPWRKLTNED